MAKDELSPEEIEKKRREQERKVKEDKERAELEKKKKEKEAKLKRIAKRQKRKQKEEMKRIKNIIDFPFKTLFHVSTLITTLYFIVIFFGDDMYLYKAIYNSFIVFTSLYLGLGIVIVTIFLVISEKKEKEFEEELRIVMEKRKEDEERQLRDMKELEEEIKLTARNAKKQISTKIEDIDLDKQIESQMNFNELPTDNEHFEDLSDFDDSGNSFLPNESIDFNEEDDYESILSDKNKK